MKILLDIGMRLRELVVLTNHDILFRENLIRVDGKGLKERFVPLSPELKNALKEYILVRGNPITDALYPLKPICNSCRKNKGNRRLLQKSFELSQFNGLIQKVFGIKRSM